MFLQQGTLISPDVCPRFALQANFSSQPLTHSLTHSHRCLLILLLNFSRTCAPCPCSVEQLERNVTMCRYYAVLTHAQKYVSCVPGKKGEEEGKLFLIVSAWEALCEYKSIQYGRCCDHIYELQQEMTTVSTSTPSTSPTSSSSSSSPSSNGASHHWNDDKDDDNVDTLYYRKQVFDMMDMQQQLADQCTKCLNKLQIVQLELEELRVETTTTTTATTKSA